MPTTQLRNKKKNQTVPRHMFCFLIWIVVINWKFTNPYTYELHFTCVKNLILKVLKTKTKHQYPSLLPDVVTPGFSAYHSLIISIFGYENLLCFLMRRKSKKLLFLHSSIQHKLLPWILKITWKRQILNYIHTLYTIKNIQPTRNMLIKCLYFDYYKANLVFGNLKSVFPKATIAFQS